MKTAPPIPGPVKNIDFPDVPRNRLDNGLEIICIEDHRLPRISVVLGIPSGRMHDPEGKRGIAQLTADMLQEGTEKRTSHQIAGELDQLAIDFRCRVFLEYTLIYCKFLESFHDQALELLSDIVLNASMPEEEWAKAVIRWKGYLAAQAANPAYLARERIYREIYPGSPLSNVTVDPATLDILAPDDLLDFHRKRLSPDKGIVGFSGPVSDDGSRAAAGRFLGSSGIPGPAGPCVPRIAPLKSRVHLIDRPGSQQARILVGLLAPARKEADPMPLKLLSQAYGGGGSSRIFMNLREEKGYTYGAYSYLKQNNYSGTFFVSTSVNNGVVRESLREIFREMDLIRRVKLSTEELDRCKAEINGSFLRQMETPSSICSMEVTRHLVGLPDNYYSKFLPQLMAVGREEVRQAAESILDPCRAMVVVVGDREQLGSEEEIEKECFPNI